MLNSLSSLIKHYKFNPDKIIFTENKKKISVKDFFRGFSYYNKYFNHKKKLTIGIVGSNSIDYAVIEAGISSTQNTLVPIPNFFNDDTIRYIIKNSNIDIIFTDEENFNRFKLLFNNTEIFIKDFLNFNDSVELLDHKRIVYTSGTTNKPKGVVHTCKQINIVTKSLIETFELNQQDKYFSILPISTLLEQICANHITLTLASHTEFDKELSRKVFSLDDNFFKKIIEQEPNYLCLSPSLTSNLITYIENNRSDSFLSQIKSICVGGSKSSISMINQAIKMKLPVFEGYGLSECCSVVAVNNKKFNKTGTCGKLLPHIECEIINGEIVIKSPTIMEGYYPNKLNQDKLYTGDLGSLNDEGYLTIYGRKDDVIILSNGRNIHPEYIKKLIQTKLLFDEVYIYQDKEKNLCFAFENIKNLNDKDIIEEIKKILPEYIYPQKIFLINKKINKQNLLLPNGKIDTLKLTKQINSGDFSNAIL